MEDITPSSKKRETLPGGSVYEGIYGLYTITKEDQIEVQRYRLSLLLIGITFFIGLGQWILIGPKWAWIWLPLIAISLGLALKWIHIYLSPLHRALQILLVLGSLGIIIMASRTGPEEILSRISIERTWVLAIGPLFASLTGIGFKEFFCFRRLEAIGLTLILPIALLGHLSGLINGSVVMTLLLLSSIFSIILAMRKFGMDAAADVGDKSIFDFLTKKTTAKAL